MNVENAKKLFSIHFPATAKRIKNWDTNDDKITLSITEQIDFACWAGFLGALKAAGHID